MEPDMVVDLIGQVVQKGLQIEGFIADDNTTVMSRVHGICSNIQKMSDKNHIKKNILNSLYNLQKVHKNMSSKVIKYTQKCFNYIISRIKGIEMELKRAFQQYLCIHLATTLNAVKYGVITRDILLHQNIPLFLMVSP